VKRLLWWWCGAVMDEFDIFMDAVSRKVALDQLLKTSIRLKHRQFIFITPQVRRPHNVVKSMRSERRLGAMRPRARRSTVQASTHPCAQSLIEHLADATSMCRT
jgi:hypothetical protein